MRTLSPLSHLSIQRLALADAAQRSLDVQYDIWKKDLAGEVQRPLPGLRRISRSHFRDIVGKTRGHESGTPCLK